MDKAYSTWIEYANRDLASAKHLLTLIPIPLEIICYHCQQSAEKILKAFLIKNDFIPSRTHDLNLLVNECTKLDDSISILKKECNRLNDFGVNTVCGND